ncbi:Heat-inducible transcription repressor HrcA [Patulibacter medicamentivorans]|jgi:heat-inducible transcriptional repressor|uniref:Heat-inducible transcription repressor HrcA n=1 Tax=Patulibacter medicamentivorans TaxID=1097667 RepID=H0E6K3_9ACTN|nr:heat-inducible transcriptional repressor HrcA [Patulibacter medicamentivorans]EHN10702.1 Heat-inducible transcription repressor HrcA [Patulibacter medicamentivorans]
MLSPRQELILQKVVTRFGETGLPVGSKLLSADPDLGFGPSTIRNELAQLEEHGLLNHPHTSAGRVPTDAGHRYFVDHLLPTVDGGDRVHLELVQREVDEAMRMTSETLSAVTDLLAVVTAPPVTTATIRHVEVLLLQPRTVMVVVITSAGEVAKRIVAFPDAVDSGLASWAKEYLNDRLAGIGLGARMLRARLEDPGLGASELRFLEALRPAFDGLGATGETTGNVYVSGAARLMHASRSAEVAHLDALVDELERRATLLHLLRHALQSPDVTVRIGAENPLPALRSLAVVAAGYGPPQRRLGSVSVIGPVRMDYPRAIRSVRDVAFQLSRYVEDLYDNA